MKVGRHLGAGDAHTWDGRCVYRKRRCADRQPQTIHLLHHLVQSGGKAPYLQSRLLPTPLSRSGQTYPPDSLSVAHNDHFFLKFDLPQLDNRLNAEECKAERPCLAVRQSDSYSSSLYLLDELLMP